MHTFIIKWLIINFVCFTFPIFAEEPCTGCGGENTYNSARAMLERAGFQVDQYTILISWEERARNNPHHMINGFRLKPNNGDPAFDVYIGENFEVLDHFELQELGIRPKNWDVKHLETKTESVSKTTSIKSPTPPLPQILSTVPSAWVEISPPDMAQVQREDEQRHLEKQALRIGVFQDITPAVEVLGASCSDGEWSERENGYVWSVGIFAEGARGQRIHFTDLQLPNGGYVLVANLDVPQERWGPYTKVDDLQNGLWAATCFGERVLVECFVPQFTDIEKTRICIDKVIYVYRGLEELYWGKASAGWCNLDVSCYPDWAETAAGVAGIGSVGAAGMLWCTGALINDLDTSTQKPYFLTANHCVGNQSNASSIEVYWFYQTSTCNGSPPSPSSVPRTTGGADYLAGSSFISGNDFSLLLLRNDPPPGVSFLGWQTTAPTVSQNIVPIHHPSGDFKRITFGYIYQLDANFIETRYNQGTTEPGSSGCPLFDAVTKKIIGQLWGGDASCSNLNGYDKYGRFDKTFPLVEGILRSEEIPEFPIITCGLTVPVSSLKNSLSSHKNSFKNSLTIPDMLCYSISVGIILIWALRSKSLMKRVLLNNKG